MGKGKIRASWKYWVFKSHPSFFEVESALMGAGA
jgi:hypothetical protein